MCDKRSADPLRKHPTFAKGTHFVCLCDIDYGDHIRLAYGGHRISGGTFTADLRNDEGSRPSKYERDAAWAKALIPHLEEIPLDSWERLTRTFGHTHTGSLLRELIEDGTVPMARAIELLRKHTLGCSPFP